MKEKTNREKFLDLVTEDAIETKAWIRDRNKKRKFYRASQKIALNILKQLAELDWTQKELAEKMDVSPQQVNKWVKGDANFTLDTLIHLGTVLGVDLIIPNPLSESKAERIIIHETASVTSFYKMERLATSWLPQKGYLVAETLAEYSSSKERLSSFTDQLA